MKLSTEQLIEIKQLYLQKHSIKELASQYGVCVNTLSKYLRMQGCIPTKTGYSHPSKFSKEKEMDIVTRYKKGETQKEIAQTYNTFNTSIRRVLLRYGIIPRSTSKVNRLCKHNPFKKHDEFSEYFLGLLITDGCISFSKNRVPSIVLSLSEEDAYMVRSFRDWASPLRKISKLYQKINGSYMYAVDITNEEALDWVYRKGNFHNKSFCAKLYTPITWNLFRGIFDGDGGFRAANSKGLQLFVCGLSKSLMLQVYNFLNKEGIKAYLRFMEPDKWHKNGIYYVFVYNYNDVITVGLKMYSNAHIFLNRKYMKWLTFYESRKQKYNLNSGKAGIANPEQNLPTLTSKLK